MHKGRIRGVTTAYGGSINIFAEKDINVNESRVMTFMGGDITVWSDKGNINAGRGSKNTGSPRRLPPGRSLVMWKRSFLLPRRWGSGIRALTYDPDGADGPLEAPVMGDVCLVAPQGFIDAGEAGIAGRRVILGSPVVLNGGNINSIAGSIGVPSSSSSSTGLGSLSGIGGVSQEMKAQETAVASAATNRFANAVTDVGSLGAGSLDVKVISYLESDDDPRQENRF